ncbi:MAG: nucleotidyltransferase family protein [Candidatus Omnitrophica bacterium]|nr:nucleotidyltransferase family protein [Candidatus Omnitrophota bacterium]
MKALILAAGYATRLYPITRNRPKPLLKIAGKPIIDYIVKNLLAIPQVDDITVVTNDKFKLDFDLWSTAVKSNKPLKVISDGTASPEKRLGAIGDIDYAVKSQGIKSDLLVIAGDNLFDFDLALFLDYAKNKEGHSAIGVCDFKHKRGLSKYGVIELNGSNRVLSFQEKPKSPKTGLVAIGVYYFPKEKLNLIPSYLEEGANSCDAPGHYIMWLLKKEEVYGYIIDGIWYDIGDIGSYLRANKQYRKKA